MSCQQSLRKLHHGKSLRRSLAGMIRNDLTIIDPDLEQAKGLDRFFLFFFLFFCSVCFPRIEKKEKLDLNDSVLPNVPSPLSKGIFHYISTECANS